MAFLMFQTRETLELKGWSTSDKYMRQKRRQERHVKSEGLSASILYFESTLVTSISPPSNWKNNFLTNTSPDSSWQPPCKTTMYSTPPD